MKDIKNFTRKELESILKGLSAPAYRAGQIFSWIYKKGASSFGTMRNLPAGLRASLGKDYYIGAIGASERLEAGDGTEKILFKLKDGNFIESVIISAGKRNTLCISTQVGCRFACRFCASGRNGLVRDLETSEILSQALYIKHVKERNITNYVFMGMGEPLDNYENVAKAIVIMNDPEGMDIGSRRITVSTCGIMPGIKRLAGLGLQINLSVSLHTAHDELRDKLMPVNKIYPLGELVKACEDYMKATGRMMTLEYILIKGANDSAAEADGLAAIAKRLKAKVNLIPYSPIPGFEFESPEAGEVTRFAKRLAAKRVKVTLRESKGGDIMAACGQLAGRKRMS